MKGVHMAHVPGKTYYMNMHNYVLSGRKQLSLTTGTFPGMAPKNHNRTIAETQKSHTNMEQNR